jgi:DNA-binding transcriptional regulator YiaG
MTPAELKAGRHELGLSAAQLGKALRLGADGGRTVRRWEAGDRAIPGPVEIVVELMLEFSRVRARLTMPRGRRS